MGLTQPILDYAVWCRAVGTSWQVLSHLPKGARAVGNLGGFHPSLELVASSLEMPRPLPGAGNREKLGVWLILRLDMADSPLLVVPSGQGFCPQDVTGIQKYNLLDI